MPDVVFRRRFRPAVAWPGRWDGPLVAVMVAALVAAGIAVLLSQTVFSHLSVNDDESVYLLQAKALAHGHLFPPAPHPADAFVPWLGVVRGDHYVMKYLPTLPALLALSLLLTGGYSALLACSAAGLVLATFLLAKEAMGSRRTAAIAAALMGASPLVIVQSGLALPYLPFLVLIELAWWGLLRGARRASFRSFALAGLCAGLGFTIRSYDAILLLLPVAGWLVVRRPNSRRILLLGLLAGAFLPMAGMLWYNAVATGSPLKLPFSLFSRQDTLGFGVRRLYPGETARHFGPAQGWQGLWRHFSLLGGGWGLGGILAAVLVGIAVIRRRYSPACLAIACGGLLLVVGYFFFWGTWNAAVLWGGTHYLGPYYLMPILVPVTMLSAAGLEVLATGNRLRFAVLTVAGVAVSGLTLGQALSANAALNADNGQLAAAVAAQGRSLVFVQTYPDYLQHPSAVIANSSQVGGRTVYAIDTGKDNFAVIRTFPGRGLYQLRLLGEYGHTPHKGFGARLEHLRQVTGHTIALKLDAKVPRSALSAQLIISVGHHRRLIALTPNRLNRRVLVLSAGQVAESGGAIALSGLATTTESATVSIRTRTATGHERTIDRLRIPLAVSASRITALAPDRLVAKLGPLPTPALTLSLPSAS